MLTLVSGLGGSTGDSLVTNTDPLMATKVLFVDSVTGSDTYSGLQRDKPFATLSAAVAASANGTIIVLLSTHTEAIGSNVTISNNYVTVVGEGSSSGVPTASFSTGNNVGITCSGVGVQLRNFKLLTSTTNNANSRIKVSGAAFMASDLYCECSGTDGAAALDLLTGASSATLRNCTFISTATVAATLPANGVMISNSVTGLAVVGCVFSNGTYGFSGYGFNDNSVLTQIRAEDISLLLGAVMSIGSAYGFVHVGTATAGGRVI